MQFQFYIEKKKNTFKGLFLHNICFFFLFKSQLALFDNLLKVLKIKAFKKSILLNRFHNKAIENCKIKSFVF